jgi:hypothetical protein
VIAAYSSAKVTTASATEIRSIVLVALSVLDELDGAR